MWILDIDDQGLKKNFSIALFGLEKMQNILHTHT